VGVIPYSEVHYHPEYKRLAAIVGKAKLGQEHWDEWARIQERYGWKMLCRAADSCDPLARWPANIEAVCVGLKKDADDTAKLMAYAPRPKAPTPQECADRAALFASIRAKHGVLAQDNT
jgi:hypothetical protein